MYTTRLYAPVSFANSVRRELDDALNQFLGSTMKESDAGNRPHPSVYVPLTLWEDDGDIYLEADLPGVDRSSLDLTFKDGQLWLSCERKVSKEDGKYLHNERLFGRFERVIPMPETIDPASIEAEFTDGVLCIKLSKKPEAQPTKITIKTGSGSKKRLSEKAKK